jgi:hypothetical protein
MLQVLKLEACQQRHLLGGSVFGYNDAFCRLQPFVRRWRAAAAAAAAAGAAAAAAAAGAAGAAGAAAGAAIGPSGTGYGNAAVGAAGSTAAAPAAQHAYVVSVDVSRAFDHVDLPTLLRLVEPLLTHDRYLVYKYAEVT